MNAKTIAQISGLVFAGFTALSLLTFARVLKRSGLTVKEFQDLVDRRGFNGAIDFTVMLGNARN